MRKAKSQNSSPLDQEKILKYQPLYPFYLSKMSSLNRHSMILYYNRKIKSFADVEIKDDCSFIDLSLNKLTDFTNFPSSLSDLTALILDSNQIVSFNGMQSSSFPKLRFLSLKQNPISQNIYFKLMCLIVFGSQLYSINGEKVNEIQRQNANKLRKLLFPHLIQGKIIANLDPPRFKEASPENEKYKTTPCRKNIQIKSRGTFSSPIYCIENTPKKASLKRRISEMINDNDIVASPTNYLRGRKYILGNENEDQKISPVKNSQRNREEDKNTNSQVKGKSNKKKFVEKNNQLIKEEQKLAKQKTSTNNTNKKEQKTAKFTNSHAEDKNASKKIIVENNRDDDKEEKIKDEENDTYKQTSNDDQTERKDDAEFIPENQKVNKIEQEEEEKCQLESEISQTEKKNKENEQICNEEQKMENDANKIVDREVKLTDKATDEQMEGKDDLENMQINKNEQILLDDKQKEQEENKQEEATKDENEQKEEEKNENNQTEEEEELAKDENNQTEEEEEVMYENNQTEEEEAIYENNQTEEEEVMYENDQAEEEEELTKDENYQMEEEEEEATYENNQAEEEEDTDETYPKTNSAPKVRFALEEAQQVFDPDDPRTLEIDKNLTVENEQEKEQDDSKFVIDHYYTYRANNDKLMYKFGNINDDLEKDT